ncbi:MAG: hypothetical protein H0T46_04390 [Deltaproteobacteria bacterium]|nr:hypothetical protein [Deltaproteobacteria bacterium]
MNRALALLVVIAGAAPAAAQSKRYPPQPIDKDKERADKSSLWEAATNPNQEPYRAKLILAKQAIEQRTQDGLRDAVLWLDEAVVLLPHSPEAYRLRGEAYFWLGDWTRCAADLRTATLETKAINALDKKAATELQLRLGNCQARAGKLADAERTFAEASAAGTGTGELLMRLGEVRIAMGKLDEAIAALTAALEVPDVQQAQTRFLLASAYDRARRPAEAIAEARRAQPFDRSLTTLSNPQLAFIGAGEAHYLLALAWASQESPRAEYALAYFRLYVKEAPESPWRKRAEEHLRDLAGTKFPETIERTAGTAPVDLDTAAAAIRKVMPAMRACMAKLPSTVIEVKYTRSGPPLAKEPTPPPGRGGYMYRPRVVAPPPEGASIRQDPNSQASSRADTDAAMRCIDPIASKLALPPVKEKGGWYQILFRVVGN